MTRRLALVVGIGECGEGFDPLPGSLQDLREMTRVLQAPDCGAFEVQALQDCDRASLEAEIERFFDGKAQEDLLLFYFSGHGDLGSGGLLHQQLHLCTRNSYKQNGRLVESSALSAGFLKRRMDLCRAQRIAVVLDCCYSGAIADLLKKGEGEIDLDELKASGRVILASSSAAKVALQEREGMSLYTRYLIEGMEGAAYPGQGDWIAARHLHDHADRRFEIECKGGYRPKIIAEDTGFDLPIVRAPKPEPKLEYRKVVDRIFQDLDRQGGLDFAGEISSPLIRKRLQIAQEKLKLTDTEAQQIELEVQLPYQSCARKRKDYAEVFEIAVQNGVLPSEFDRQMLKEIAQDLGLGQEEIERIEQDVRQRLNLKAPEPRGAAVVPERATVSVQSSTYAELERLLQAKEWREADRETYRLMIVAVGREDKNYLSREDLENFPCEDLKMLDRLWVKYSDGKWGFSVQKQIWEECGSPIRYHEEWEKFGDRVGWRQNGKWLDYEKLSFDLEKTFPGEMPALGVCCSVLKHASLSWGYFWYSLLSHKDL